MINGTNWQARTVASCSIFPQLLDVSDDYQDQIIHPPGADSVHGWGLVDGRWVSPGLDEPIGRENLVVQRQTATFCVPSVTAGTRYTT